MGDQNRWVKNKAEKGPDTIPLSASECKSKYQKFSVPYIKPIRVYQTSHDLLSGKNFGNAQVENGLNKSIAL